MYASGRLDAALQQLAGRSVRNTVVDVIERTGVEPDACQHVGGFDASFAQQGRDGAQRGHTHDTSRTCYISQRRRVSNQVIRHSIGPKSRVMVRAVAEYVKCG